MSTENRDVNKGFRKYPILILKIIFVITAGIYKIY